MMLSSQKPLMFPEMIIELLGFDPELPPSLEGLEGKEEMFDKLPHDYEEFKKYLKEKY